MKIDSELIQASLRYFIDWTLRLISAVAFGYVAFVGSQGADGNLDQLVFLNAVIGVVYAIVRGAFAPPRGFTKWILDLLLIEASTVVGMNISPGLSGMSGFLFFIIPFGPLFGFFLAIIARSGVGIFVEGQQKESN